MPAANCNYLPRASQGGGLTLPVPWGMHNQESRSNDQAGSPGDLGPPPKLTSDTRTEYTPVWERPAEVLETILFHDVGVTGTSKVPEGTKCKAGGPGRALSQAGLGWGWEQPWSLPPDSSLLPASPSQLTHLEPMPA